MRECARESGWGERPVAAGDTNRVPRCLTRIEPTPRCMWRWYRLSVFEQASQRFGACLIELAAGDGDGQLTPGRGAVQLKGPG